MSFAPLHPRRWFLALVCLGVFAAGSAGRAETLNIPADGSGISLDLPAGWTSDRKGDALICTSPDGGVRFEFTPWHETGDPLDALRKAAHKIADMEKITVNEEKEETPETNRNGARLRTYQIKGTSKDGNRVIGAALLTTPHGTPCLACVVINPANARKYSGDVESMFDSFRSAGGTAAATPPGGFNTVPVPPAGKNGPGQFPADGSSITFTVPPGWTATPEGANLRVATADGTLAVVFMPADAVTDAATQLPAMARSLADGNGVTDAKGDERDHQSRSDESVTIHSVALAGKRDGHEVIAVVALVSPARGQRCLVELVIDTVAAKAHQQECEKFLDSFKSAK